MGVLGAVFVAWVHLASYDVHYRVWVPPGCSRCCWIIPRDQPGHEIDVSVTHPPHGADQAAIGLMAAAGLLIHAEEVIGRQRRP